MEHNIDLNWHEGMHFSTEINGHTIHLDADESNGGNNDGPRPKPLMLAALAGCTGMDVINILERMKVKPESFHVKLSGSLSEEHPKQYTSMHIIYEFKGADLPMDKLEKAVNLSQEKYCGVSAMYRKFLNLTHEIKII